MRVLFALKNELGSQIVHEVAEKFLSRVRFRTNPRRGRITFPLDGSEKCISSTSVSRFIGYRLTRIAQIDV